LIEEKGPSVCCVALFPCVVVLLCVCVLLCAVCWQFNLASHVHPIFRPADGGYGQNGETFFSQPNLFLPADTSASGFYILNAANSFIGNAASGGWAGFAFPNAVGPVGNFKGTLPANSPYV
jgi:hypothetical protein